MRAKSRLSQTAVLTLISGMASIGLPSVSAHADAAPHPVAARDTFVDLVAPSRVPGAQALAGGDLAGAASRAFTNAGTTGAQVRVTGASEATAVPSAVAVVGVTWRAGTGQGASVQYRAEKNGRWSAWSFVDADPEHAPDPASDEAKHARAGSEPIVLTDATAVQVRMFGDGTHVAAQPRLMVADPGGSAADNPALATAVAPALATAATSSTSKPVIYTRAQWGAKESLRRAPPEYGAVKGAFVHHTVNANSYRSSQVPAIIRAIYAYHVQGRGWNDIGYNFLIDRFGRTWEGRYGGVDRPVIGAHTLGHNAYSFGASAIGNYDIAAVPTMVTSAFVRLIAWKAQIHQFKPSGISNISGDTLNSVSGHRDVFGTTCPGRYLYAKLPAIRAGAAALVRGLPSLSIARDVNNQNHGDVLATDANHELRVYSGSGHGSITGPTYLSHGGWVGVDLVTIPGDWDGNGTVDVLARKTSTGQLLLYPGNGFGGFLSTRVVGVGWGVFDALVAPGDWSGDGHPDLLARTRDGKLHLYPGNGHGRFLAPRLVGVGWSAMTRISAMGDWTGDGHVDLIAVDKAGVAHVYPGAGAGRFVARLTIGPGWGNYLSVSALGDETNDTRTDLFVVDKAGVAWIGVRGSSARAVSWLRQSSGWGAVSVYTG